MKPLRAFCALIVGLALAFAVPVHAQLAAPNDLGVTYGHVHLTVTDVELHKKLWTELFDGEVVQKGPLVTVKVPGTYVIFTEREPTAGSLGTAMDHFGFKVRSMAEVLAEWRALGYEVDAEFDGAEGYANAYITMPDGARFELQEDPALTVKAEMYHVHFFTPGYEDLLDWYADVFGATPRARGTIQTTADVPGSNLSFADSEEERLATRGTAIDHIGFEVDDLDAFAERLAERGVELEFEPRYIDAIELKIAFFTDPSGVRVELTEGLHEYTNDGDGDPDPARFAEEMTAFERWDSKNSSPDDALLFVGSSSIRFWDTSARFPNVDLINRGFGGAHISDVNHYIDETVLQYDPDVVVFYAGDNDTAAGKTPDQIVEDYTQFVEAVHKADAETEIVFFAIKPSLARWDIWPDMQASNGMIKAMSAKDDRLHFADVGPPMLGSDGMPSPELFVDDGLHMTPAGYDVWDEVLEGVLKKIH